MFAVSRWGPGHNSHKRSTGQNRKERKRSSELRQPRSSAFAKSLLAAATVPHPPPKKNEEDKKRLNSQGLITPYALILQATLLINESTAADGTSVISRKEVNNLKTDGQKRAGHGEDGQRLQRLKRSLSFKSVMRSKSTDNFFQRSNGESRPPSALITSPPPLPSPPRISESPLAYERSPSRSPSTSPNPSLSSRSPSISPSKTMNFKTKPKSQAQPPSRSNGSDVSPGNSSPVELGNSKQGLRCKACKLAAHLWCSSELSQQPCTGKTGAFKRNFSSPLLATDTLGVVIEAPAAQEADNGLVDPVYEALRYGTSLAQMCRSSFSSISESPCHEEEKLQDKRENQPGEAHIPGMLTPPESEKADSEDRVSLKAWRQSSSHRRLQRGLVEVPLVIIGPAVYNLPSRPSIKVAPASCFLLLTFCDLKLHLHLFVPDAALHGHTAGDRKERRTESRDLLNSSAFSVRFAWVEGQL
ncbi:SH3 and cysteine-rich domain-containing protein 2 [Liparis tanakae]|uniref:SH3 and cysteine-rich domain-containing protein 2 n=1 Tax=Liparis tanakae TaxID=230148 RepID=A0A4Z2FY92_9TELE|nr:SH3 and cysteine-rich domain-containing protein 2 [Liparis tanakae]